MPWVYTIVTTFGRYMCIGHIIKEDPLGFLTFSAFLRN